MANDSQGKSSQSIIAIVAIVFLAALVFSGLGGYLLCRQASNNVKQTDETPAPNKVVSEIPAPSERIDEAKWSEGRAMIGSIATAIRAYRAKVGPTGPRPTTLYVGKTGIGFARYDLRGSYFGDEDFSFEVASMNPLKFTITCTAGKSGISRAPSTPSAYTLNQDCVFKPQ